MIEKRWKAVLPQSFVSSGTLPGQITVADATMFHVKQQVIISASSIPSRDDLEIKRIVDKNTMFLGPRGGSIDSRENLSAYVSGLSPFIYANEQLRSKVPEQEIERHTYEEEPVVARRVILVDSMGEKWSSTNPFPIDGVIDAEIRGVYDSVTNPNPDNVGVVLQTRNTTSYDSDQKERQTAKRGTVDTNVVAADISLHDQNGNSYTKTNPVPVEFGSIPTIEVSGISSDAFGRLRISNPFALGDYTHAHGPNLYMISRITNGATVSFPSTLSCARLATTSNISSQVVYQSRAYHHYQPGKSQLIYSSIHFGYAQQNVTKRTGYYDDNNGIYFEQVGSSTSNGTDNGTLNFVIRSNVGGTMSEASIGSYIRRVPQSQWNKDKCDGTGASGFNINTSNTTLLYIDFQWLGIGNVRCGFIYNGEVIIAHEYSHANILNTVYMSTPNLPVRCELVNTGATSGGTMDCICASVASEGGYAETGTDWAVSGITRSTSAPGGTVLPLLAIRLKNSFNGHDNRIGVKPNSVSFFVEGNSIAYSVVKLINASYLNTTLNGGTLTWTSVNNNSAVEYCANATNLVDGTWDVFATGFVPAGSSQNSLSPATQSSLSNALSNVISQNIDSSDSEVYAILVRTVSTQNNVTATVAASMQWRELY